MTDGTPGPLDGLSARGSSAVAHSQASSHSRIGPRRNGANVIGHGTSWDDGQSPGGAASSGRRGPIELLRLVADPE